MRWFEKHLPEDGSVRIHRFDQTLVGLSIAGPKRAGAAAEAGRRGRLDQGLPLHGFPRDGGRRRALHGQPHQLYRRSRLRDLDAAGLPAPGLQGDQGRRRRNSASSISACARCCRCGWRRTSRPGSASCRPIYGPFEGAHGPLHQAGEERLHRPRRRARGSCEPGPKLRRVSLRGRRGRRRRDGRRADLGQGQPATTARSRSRTATARRASTRPARRCAAQGREGASAVRGIATATGAWSAG